MVEVLHGREVPDPYRWLEDPASPETRRWLAAQDGLWERWAARLLPGRERLRRRVAELSAVGSVTAPVWRAGRRFLERAEPGDEHARLILVEPDGAEMVLLDPVALDPTGTTTLDAWQPSLDGRRVAIQLSRGGDERAELSVVDLDERRVVDGPIAGCRYSPVAWLAGGDAFVYVRASPDRPERERPLLHRVGAPAESDLAIPVDDPDTSTGVGAATSFDGRWLVLSATRLGQDGNDLWLADMAAAPAGPPALRLLHRAGDGATAAAVGFDGRLYLATTIGHPRGRICVADPERPVPGEWRELCRADGDAVLAGMTLLGGPALGRPRLLAAWSRAGVSEVTVHDAHTGERTGEVPLPGAGTVGSPTVRPEGGHEAWFAYTDAVTPASVHRYDATTGRTTPWGATAPARAAAAAETRRVTYRSADGTAVGMALIARPGPPGPRPALLYGYGGFGQTATPSYSSFALAWVEAGGVFALPGLRGGGEGGEEWHRAGAGGNKQAVFDDFVAAAEWLVAGGWTTPERLAICGESNGGLLVGAALTQRPDLFAAAVCSAPLLDMVRYERFGLGPAWRGEYGSADDPVQFGWLLSYSPYHRVRRGVEYPAVLFTVFEGDTRVDPMHARKMCAALQDATAGAGPVLLRREADRGHGATSASRSVALAADMLAFLGAHTGLGGAADGDVRAPGPA